MQAAPEHAPSPAPRRGRAAYVCAWEYVVRPDRLEEFERIYGPDGEWAQLFRAAPGYQGTELFRDRSQPTRFLTFDYWASREAWERFRRTARDAYAELDARCEQLTEREREAGRFQPVDLG